MRNLTLFLGFMGLLSCAPQKNYPDDLATCAALNGEARMLCLRPDLAPLYAEIQSLRLQTQERADGEAMRRFANVRSEEVYEYCYARYEREANCVSERWEALRDQLSLQLNTSEALS